MITASDPRHTYPLREHDTQQEQCQEAGRPKPAVKDKGRDAVKLVLVCSPKVVVLRLELGKRRAVKSTVVRVHHVSSRAA
jgi:hypothetical protein